MTDLVLEPKGVHGSQDWLAARHRDGLGRARITASVAAAILGEHEFMTPADLAVQQLRDEPPDEQMTEAMERGHDLEPVLLDRWGRRHGLSMVRPKVMYVRGRFLANLDGDVGAPLEAKSTTHHFTPQQFGSKPFRYWLWQGVTQAWCYYGGPGLVHWSILDGNLQFKEHEQWVSQEEIDRLLAAGEEWLSFIDEGMPPIGVELTDKHVAKLNPGGTGEVDLPSDAPIWVRRLADARALKKRGEDDEAEAKTWLARHLGGADVGLFDGKPIVTWKEQAGRLGFDSKAFRREYPDLYQKFERRGEPFRKMLPKGTNGDDD